MEGMKVDTYEVDFGGPPRSRPDPKLASASNGRGRR
jgi:hypothetical protein